MNSDTFTKLARQLTDRTFYGDLSNQLLPTGAISLELYCKLRVDITYKVYNSVSIDIGLRIRREFTGPLIMY